MNGAAGLREYGFSSTFVTRNDEPSSREARPRAASSSSCRASVRAWPSGPKSRPVATRCPSRPTSRAWKLSGSKVASEVPPRGGAEGHPLALSLDDEPRRDRLDAAGAEAGHDLLPEHGRDLVAVETVEDAPRLLRVDEPHVDLARLLQRPRDRRLRDLVEDHPLDGNLGLEHLVQVPGDRLALAVFVRREQELVGVLEERLQLGDLLLLVRVDDVERAEVVLDVDAEPRPLLLLVLGRDVRGALREGRGCGRRRTRRRSPGRGIRRWSGPSPGTRR